MQLYRHGDRTPVRSYPKDPYKDLDKYWPQGPGQLTQVNNNSFNVQIKKQFSIF